MQIEITQPHINQGRSGSATDCAIARAMKEQLSLEMGRVPHVYVNASVVAIDGRTIPATPEISDFVSRFDKDKSLVSPVNITISPCYFAQSGMFQHQYASVKPSMMLMDGNGDWSA